MFFESSHLDDVNSLIFKEIVNTTNNFNKKFSRFIPYYLTEEWSLFCKYVVCFQNTSCNVWYNANVFNISGMCRTVTDIFKQKVSELTFMNDNFQIHSKEKKTYPHAIDRNCVTYICIPGEPSSMVTFHSQPSHPASSFQSSKRSVVNKKSRAKITCLKVSVAALTLEWLGWLVRKKPPKNVPDKNLSKYLQ